MENVIEQKNLDSNYEHKIRVLIIAEAANPEWTSVPLIGSSLAKAISKVCDSHLATQVRNEAALERAGWRSGENFTAIDSERVIAPLHKLANLLRGGKSLGWTISTAMASIAYPYFEYQCWKKFRADLVKGNFDIVHRITPVSPTAPSYLAKKLKKIGVPFVVGPLNGGVPWPSEFRNLQHKEREWLSYVRFIYKFIPGYSSLRKLSTCIIAGSIYTKSEMPKYAAKKVVYLPENAIDPERFSLKNVSSYSLPVRAAFVGRLVPYKGADMAIDAMEALCKSGKMTYDIYGSGPEEESLRAKIKEKGLEEWITLHGFVPNSELQNRLVNADIFVFPSVREFGGGVVLEAMALGVVPVIVNYAGPAELVDDNSGFRIEMGSGREGLVSNLRNILTNICENPSQIERKRIGAIQFVFQYLTWEKKAEQIVRIYKFMLSGSGKDFSSISVFPVR